MKNRIIRLRRYLYGAASFLLRHLVFIIITCLVFLFIFVGLKVSRLTREVGLQKINALTFFKSPDQVLDNTNGRTNFLILGIRGEGADSPDLTDTMLIVSYSYSRRSFTFISIPRDLWVNSLKTKINSVYHYGQFREPVEGGIKLVQSTILETLGVPIHYTAVIDFSFFQKAVDLVGGVDVTVINSFTDTQFPVTGRENALPIESRFETITFNAGLQHMDGATALKFVRSRHAEGDEGTDIARDHRQQQVISALKQKIVSPQFLMNQKNLSALYRLLKEHLDTNLDEKLYPSLARLAFDSYRHPTQEIILSYEPDQKGFAILENPPVSSLYLNQWVLIAIDNNWPALQQYLQNRLEGRQ